MPKKLYPSEPPVIFQALYRGALEVDNDFVIHTTDPVPETFADALIAKHYPPQVRRD